MNYEEISEQMRNPESPEEKAFRVRAYEIGMKNGWCNGRYAMEDGNPIVENDRLNMNSFTVIESEEALKAFFAYGNWCLGQAVIFKDLCFIQQVNGGDEWLAIKNFDDGTLAFESMSWGRIIDIDSPKNEFEDLIARMLKADRTACESRGY